ncbi:MAG: phosphatidylglycerophosphatase A [Pseudohongiellaceae bacterium]
MKLSFKKNKVPTSVFIDPVHFLAFGLGSGAAPWAPGTFGTLAAVVLYLPLSRLSLEIYLLMLVLTFGIGIYLCEQTSRDLGEHDHGGIVWDEFVGFWITMLAAPPGWLWILLGFVLFRFFDIVKPFPIGIIDRRLGGGLGIMLDDALAGAYAWLCLQIIALTL